MSELTTLLRERSWHLFVDGDNFAKRGAAALMAEGPVRLAEGPYERDVYLWLPQQPARHAFFAQQPMFFPNSDPGWAVPLATRAYYYTSRPADGEGWTETQLALRALGFEPRLFPRVKGRSKSVDLALATEALTLAAERAAEASVIFTCDGDFVPVIEAMKRLGQRVIVGSFAQDTNPQLIIAADDFVDLTPLLVRAWRELREAEGEP